MFNDGDSTLTPELQDDTVYRKADIREVNFCCIMCPPKIFYVVLCAHLKYIYCICITNATDL